MCACVRLCARPTETSCVRPFGFVCVVELRQHEAPTLRNGLLKRRGCIVCRCGCVCTTGELVCGSCFVFLSTSTRQSIFLISWSSKPSHARCMHAEGTAVVAFLSLASASPQRRAALVCAAPTLVSHISWRVPLLSVVVSPLRCPSSTSVQQQYGRKARAVFVAL